MTAATESRICLLPIPLPSGSRKDSTAPAAWAEFSADIWRVTVGTGTIAYVTGAGNGVVNVVYPCP